MKRVVRNPYAAVDWSTFGRYKANLHTHTTESDGELTPAEAIDMYHERGFGILSLTDHDTIGSRQPTWPWTAFGRDPDQLGMLAIEGNEPSNTHHIGSYLNGLWVDNADYNADSTSIAAILGRIGNLDGLAQMAHPGRYTSYTDQFYVDLHETHPHLNGHEVYNQGNRYPTDKSRWDRLLELARDGGLDLPLWGWSVDDAHFVDRSDFGANYHVQLMPTLDEPSFRQSIIDGAFWFVFDPQGASDLRRHVRVEAPAFFSIAPIIHRIRVRATSITVNATGHDGVRWISNGVEVATGATISLDTDGLGGYVRAEMNGRNGSITLTQPFYLDDDAATTTANVDGVPLTSVGGSAIVDIRS